VREEVAGDVRDVVVEARDLELGYRGAIILRDVELAIRNGESWFFLGANGSGKTTLVRAAIGLLAPRRGSLRRHARLGSRRRLGFVPQVSEINPSLRTTVREFVSLGLAGSVVARSERGEHLAWALERMGLSALEQADYWSLSGGQRRRTQVARALVRRPSWMVLDEPTEGLDIATEESLLSTLDDLNRRESVTLIFVTHKLALAERHASHVALFHDGRVLAGPCEAVLRSEPALRLLERELEARC
jgi:ABC-type Mn2+/Zn2+ transport system ATPase subunit